MLLTGGGNGSPAAQVVSILKPAALAYLEIESQLPTSNDSAAIDINLNRSDIEFDFMLSMKSYSLSLNALSALGLNRPMFFKDSALCLARRATQPPVFVENGALTKAAVLAITAHLKASCLTLLRNALSVSTNSSEYLHEALKRCDMEIQATKALSMAKQANSLKTAGRAARNRANMFYEWDASAEKLPSKRQRDTDDALAKMRAAKKARGLGQGIQLPKNMADAVELVVANLSHLPPKRPPGAAPKSRRVPVTLDFVIDAIMTNGASLAQEEGRWYDRDGGDTWSIHWENQQKYELSDKFLKIISGSDNADVKAKKTTKDPQALFQEQAECAASDAVGRIAIQSMNFRSKHHSDFGNELAARLAWTLKKVKAPAPLAASSAMAAESLPGLSSRLATPEKRESLSTFLKNYPIVNSCLALDSTIKPENSSGMTSQDPAFIREKGRSLSDHILFEAYVQTLMTQMDSEDSKTGKVETYENSIGMCLASVVRAAQLTDEKPSDAERKQVAVQALSVMQGIFGSAPQIFMSSLEMAGALCDVADITKRSVDAARKSSQQTIAASAALHAAKVAAEKRATTFLLMLRDVAFGRSERETRGGAVECAVMVASGSLPSSHSIEEKSLKLVMNVLYPRSDLLAACVIRAASSELLKASTFAASKYEDIRVANSADKNEKTSIADNQNKSSVLEREVMETVKKPALLLMALCVRRPELIKTLFEVSCRDKADALHKAVQANMAKMAKAVGAKEGTAVAAKKVAGMAGEKETTLVLSFLDNLAPSTDKNFPSDDFIEACYEIQASKVGEDGQKDPRYIIPVVSAIKRKELAEKLADFVASSDEILLGALERMGDRVARQALLFRDEPDEENPSLKGMTLCEQLVFLHNLDFAAAGLPQKRYLDAIRLCLDNDDVFSDRVVMAALDHMSGVFLTAEKGLPLAYMRTIILVCSKHESLHSWITSVLLPRLVEGKVYTDRRQWEGWMRCAKMLENTGDSGVSSLQAIRSLPEEQFELYRTRYGEPGGNP